MITSLLGKFTVWSPRNRRLAILLLYQALGNAKISLSRRISYLNEADPISHTADAEIKFVRAQNRLPDHLTLYILVIRHGIIPTVLIHKIQTTLYRTSDFISFFKFTETVHCKIISFASFSWGDGKLRFCHSYERGSRVNYMASSQFYTGLLSNMENKSIV